MVTVSEKVAIAMIQAASNIAVAKINAKGSKFDNYCSYRNWFKESLNDVTTSMSKMDVEGKEK